MTNAEAAVVLVVEDNVVNRRLLERGVEELGHVVRTAANGNAALEQLRQDGIDLVLLDLVMPGLDGFGVLETMRSDPALDTIPVIVISSIDESEQIARSIELGAIDCLPKPFDPLLLRVRVATALRQRRLRQLEQAYLRQELALRQSDKLATLGRLSAGLAHEINNPVAAALRLASQLTAQIAEAGSAVDELVSDDVRALVSVLVPAPGDPVDTIDQVELEDSLEDAGVGEPWLLVAGLTEHGVSPARIRSARQLPNTEDVFMATVRWLAARAEGRRGAAQLSSSLHRVSEIVSALRSYSYMDRAPQQDVHVHTGLDDTITILEHKTPSGVEIEREYGLDVPTIAAFGGQLNQVFTNILDNAIAAVAGNGTITIRTSAEGSDDGVVVEIHDDGPGVPTDLLGSIFDPFVTTKQPGEGTGLGLSIAYQIIHEGHGGRLSVDSQPGDTTFRIWLPRTVEPAPGSSTPDTINEES